MSRGFTSNLKIKVRILHPRHASKIGSVEQRENCRQRPMQRGTYLSLSLLIRSGRGGTWRLRATSLHVEDSFTLVFSCVTCLRRSVLGPALPEIGRAECSARMRTTVFHLGGGSRGCWCAGLYIPWHGFGRSILRIRTALDLSPSTLGRAAGSLFCRIIVDLLPSEIGNTYTYNFYQVYKYKQCILYKGYRMHNSDAISILNSAFDSPCLFPMTQKVFFEIRTL